MGIRKLIFIFVLISFLSALSVHAQVTSGGTKHFEKNGLEFDYPGDWKLTDRSTEDGEYIAVGPESGAVQIAVMARFGSERDCDFQAASKKSVDALIEGVANQIHATRPLQISAVRTQVGVADTDGFKLHGIMNNRPVTSEVYSLRVYLRFVHLIYLRIDDDARAQAAWDSIRTTLKLVAPVYNAAGAHARVPGNPNVLNGRALHLAHPNYPAIARQANASGKVVVQVVIDEFGNVASAHAIEGHPLLQAVSVAAASASKFSPPKVCGEPVRISGVIEYNFLP